MVDEGSKVFDVEQGVVAGYWDATILVVGCEFWERWMSAELMLTNGRQWFWQVRS